MTHPLAPLLALLFSSPAAQPLVERPRAVAPLAHDPLGRVVSVTDPRGVTTALELNALGEPVTISRGADVSLAVMRGQLPTGEAPLRYVTRLFRDHNGRVVRSEVENRVSSGGPWVHVHCGQWVHLKFAPCSRSQLAWALRRAWTSVLRRGWRDHPPPRLPGPRARRGPRDHPPADELVAVGGPLDAACGHERGGPPGAAPTQSNAMPASRC